MENIAERLKALRATLNLTQAEFAEKIGRKQATYSYLESSKAKVSHRVIMDISRVYNVSEEWLTTGQGSMFKMPNNLNTELASELGKIIASDDEWVKQVIIKFLQLPPEYRNAFKDFLKDINTE